MFINNNHACQNLCEVFSVCTRAMSYGITQRNKRIQAKIQQ